MQRSAVTDQYEKIGSTAEVEQRAFAKIAWRFVPILTLGFLLKVVCPRRVKPGKVHKRHKTNSKKHKNSFSCAFL